MAEINDQYLQSLRVAIFQFTRESSNFTNVLSEVFDNLDKSSKKSAKQYDISTNSVRGFSDSITTSSSYLKEFKGYIRDNNRNIAESNKSLREYADKLDDINKQNKNVKDNLKGFSESLKNSTNTTDAYIRNQMIAMGKSTAAFDIAMSKQNDKISEAFADLLNPIKTLTGLKEYDAVKKELISELKKNDGKFNANISALGKKLQSLGMQMDDSALVSMGHVDKFTDHLGKALSLYEAGLKTDFSDITDELERSTAFTTEKIDKFGDALEDLMINFSKSGKTFEDVKKFYAGENGLTGLKDLLSVLKVNDSNNMLKFDELIKDFDALNDISSYIKQINDNNGEVSNSVKTAMDGILTNISSDSIASSILEPLKEVLEQNNIKKDIAKLSDEIYDGIINSNGILTRDLVDKIDALRGKQSKIQLDIPEFDKLYQTIDKIDATVAGGIDAAIANNELMKDWSKKDIKQSQNLEQTLFGLVSGKGKLKQPAVDTSIKDQLSTIDDMTQSITAALSSQVKTVLDTKASAENKINSEISKNNERLYKKIYDTVGGSLALVDNLIIDKSESWKGLKSNINEIAREAFKDTSIAISDDFYKYGINGLHDFNKAMAQTLISLEKNENSINDSNVEIVEQYVAAAKAIGNTSEEIGIINDKLNEYAKAKLDNPNADVKISISPDSIEKMTKSSDATIEALDKFAKGVNKTFTRHQIAFSTIIDKQLSEQNNIFGKFIYNFGKGMVQGGGGGSMGMENALNEFTGSLRSGILPALQSIALNSKDYITSEAQALFNSVKLDRVASQQLQEGDSAALKKLADSKAIWQNMSGGIDEFTKNQLDTSKTFRDVIGVDAEMRTKEFVELMRTQQTVGVLDTSGNGNVENNKKLRDILNEAKKISDAGIYSQTQTLEIFNNTVRSAEFLKVSAGMDKKRRTAQEMEVMTTIKFASALNMSTEAAKAFAIASASAGSNLSPQQMISNIATTLKTQNILDYYAKELGVKSDISDTDRAKMSEIENKPAQMRTDQEKEFFNEFLLKMVKQNQDEQNRLTELSKEAEARGDKAAVQQYSAMSVQLANQFDSSIAEYSGGEKDIIAAYVKQYPTIDMAKIEKDRKEGETLTQAIVRQMDKKSEEKTTEKDTLYNDTIINLSSLAAQWKAFTENIVGSNILALGTAAVGILSLVADFGRVASMLGVGAVAAEGAAGAGVAAGGAAVAAEAGLGAAAIAILPEILAALGIAGGVALFAYGAKGVYDYFTKDGETKADRGDAIHGIVDVNNLDIYTNQVTDAIDTQTQELLKGFATIMGNPADVKKAIDNNTAVSKDNTTTISDNVKTVDKNKDDNKKESKSTHFEAELADDTKKFSTIPDDIKKSLEDSKQIQKQSMSQDKERYATIESLVNDSKGPTGFNFGMYDINDDEKIQKYIDATKIDTKQLYNKEELSNIFKEMFGDNKEHNDKLLTFLTQHLGTILEKGLEPTQRQAAYIQAAHDDFPNFFNDNTTIPDAIKKSIDDSKTMQEQANAPDSEKSTVMALGETAESILSFLSELKDFAGLVGIGGAAEGGMAAAGTAGLGAAATAILPEILAALGIAGGVALFAYGAKGIYDYFTGDGATEADKGDAIHGMVDVNNLDIYTNQVTDSIDSQTQELLKGFTTLMGNPTNINDIDAATTLMDKLGKPISTDTSIPLEGLNINPLNGNNTMIEQSTGPLPSNQINNTDINTALEDLKSFLAKEMISAMLSKFDAVIANTGNTAKNTGDDGLLGGLVASLGKPASQPFNRGTVENAASLTG